MTIQPHEPAGRRRFLDVRHVASTGSTNADVLALGRDGSPEGVVLIADTQTAGRGRHDRRWLAEPGSALLTSVLLRPPFSAAGLVTAALALAALDATVALGAVGVGIKWPNDLIVESDGSERKLAGILAEADWPASANISAGWREPAADDRVLVVAGIGMNLRAQASLPVEVAERAIALEALIGAEAEVDVEAEAEIGVGVGVDRDRVAETLLDCFDVRYRQLLDDPSGLVADWRRSCVTLGRAVRLDVGVDDIEGTAIDIDDRGHLIVDQLVGGRRTCAAGDVVHLRRSPASRTVES